MRINKQLAVRMAAVAAMATLTVTSAFAEDRPSEETKRGRDDRAVIQRERSREARRGDSSINNRDRRRRSDDRDRGTYRDNDRNRGTYRDNDRRSSNHQPYYAHGRVSRVTPYRGGYRVYVSGARYPFFVPHNHYHRDRFRVGLTIRLGGYYNPAGYYDYYDGRGYSRGELRGIVESVDYRRDTFVIRNEATGSFVTVVSRDRRDGVRAGDYVELRGDWSRHGVFQARDVDVLDYGYRR